MYILININSLDRIVPLRTAAVSVSFALCTENIQRDIATPPRVREVIKTSLGMMALEIAVRTPNEDWRHCDSQSN